MDDCAAHVGDDVIRILTEARVCVITFVPSTIQIFQVLDLTLFGVLNRLPRYELPRVQANNATTQYVRSLSGTWT
jgi:hypothetical protein